MWIWVSYSCKKCFIKVKKKKVWSLQNLENADFLGWLILEVIQNYFSTLFVKIFSWENVYFIENLNFYWLYSISGLSKSGFYQRRIFLSVGDVKRSECTANLTGLSFFLQPISAQCWRRAGCKILRILGKQTQKDLLNLWRNRKHCELKPRKLWKPQAKTVKAAR